MSDSRFLRIAKLILFVLPVFFRTVVAPAVEPWDKYHVEEETLWSGNVQPLPDFEQDIMYYGSNFSWFGQERNGELMIREMKRLFPDTQFVLSGYRMPERANLEDFKKYIELGAFVQLQKSPVLDTDALEATGELPLGDQGRRLRNENWVIATTPNLRDFFYKKMLAAGKYGIRYFKQIDLVYPYDQRYAYDETSVNLFREYLCEKDDGLSLVGEDGKTGCWKFWDYFQYYHGLKLKPEDLGLKSFADYCPVRENEVFHGGKGSLENRRNWTVFTMLWAYEHLRQFQRFGRWAGELNGIHEATLNPESIYNALDYVTALRLRDFGTIFLEFFGSPINADGAYLYHGIYLRAARRASRKIGLIKELGQTGHGRPHNTPIIEYLHNFDLVSSGFDFYHNEWETDSMAKMLDRKYPYNHNRWLTYVGGAFGYKDSRNLRMYKPKSRALTVSQRAGGFYQESLIGDGFVRNSFGKEILNHLIEADGAFPGELAGLIDGYDTLFYTPIYSRREEARTIGRWLKHGDRLLITHSFIPYSLDRGAAIMSWEEPTGELEEHYRINAGGRDNWLLHPVFRNIRLETGEKRGEVKVFGETLGELTLPEYWRWTPPNSTVLATIGGEPLISLVKLPGNNRIVYWHARPFRLDGAMLSRLFDRVASALQIPRLAEQEEGNGVLLHRFRSGIVPGAEALVIYDRNIMNRDGAVVGYRNWDDWDRVYFQYAAPEARGRARYNVSAPGEYLIYYLLAGREEKHSADAAGQVPVSLDKAFADVVYVVPADENGRSFLEERKRFRETLIRELEFDPAAPPHPTDYLRERVPGENE